MTTDITALAQSLKNAASKALIEEGLTWFSEEQLSHEDGIAIHKADAEFIALANPANVLALVEALEKSEKTSEARREAIDVTHKRAARERDRANAAEEALEKAQAAERRWHRVASRIHEQACESDVKIDELEAIRAAAERLVRCKGRYHSEQNYRALAALFGVTTPDLPPLDSESRTVTVKLPQAVSAGGQGYQEQVERILTAVGIKVEAE
ncbi:ead/Ea22-like family protein [Klebsiella pneumoniae]|nr:ead/Ea22-like family protein [Klebsiella pneumoniae]